MSAVLARFRLDKVTRMGGSYEGKSVEGAYVELYAVQGEPFGSATPSGLIRMGIVNPAAAQVFLDAPIGTEFSVLLTPLEPEIAAANPAS